MKKISYLISGVLIILLFSCSNNKDFSPTFKGYLDEGDWINPHTIGKYGGVKGDYCSKVDSINQYSYGFKKLFSEISPNVITKIKASVWIKLNDLTKKVVFVISVSGKDNKNIYWAGHDVNASIKEVNNWYKYEIEEVLPDFESEGARIDIYVFNPNNNIAFVDDFEISFLEK